MGITTSFSEIINQSNSFREVDYISYFFSEIVGMKESKPTFFKYENVHNTFLTIVKDSTNRILENKKGKLMERSWRNTIFYFVDKKTYIDYFGTNSIYPSYVIDESKIKFLDETNSKDTRFPNDPRLRADIFYGFQKYMFDLFKESNSSWFVRSYVYFVLVLCDKNSRISEQDFNIYYWNTNYAFRQVNGKRNIFNNTANSFFVENIQSEIALIEMTNRDAIDCVNAFKGSLDFRNQTDENFNDIVQDWDNGINYILVRGSARTGKTIIAMRLLGKYPASKLLIMNHYFFVALKDSFKIQNVDFPLDRIFHHNLNHEDGCWIKNKRTKQVVFELDFVIVDEAQRLAYLNEYVDENEGFSLPAFDELKTLLFNKNQITTVLLGDDQQKINPLYDEGFSRIYNLIGNQNFREYYFKKSVGVSPEILENIKYLLDIDHGGQVQSSYNFSFNLTNDPKEFISWYKSDKNAKKHYVAVGLRPLRGQCITADGYKISEYPEELRRTDYPFLFNTQILDKYFLSTYEVISREIVSVYLYLPEEVTYSFEKKSIVFKNSNDKKYNDFLINHIYTLMTRATMKLSVLCCNDSLYSFFKPKIEYIHQISQESQRQADTEDNEEERISFEYDLFIAYHGTNDVLGSYSCSKEICDALEAKGYRVFLNNYAANQKDRDLGFNETKHIIQRSNKFLLVLNDSIYRDEYGMIPRKYPDNKVNQLYSELMLFDSLVDDDLRTYKSNFKFFYDGSSYGRHNIYNFLNRLYRIGTMGNSNCCLFKIEEVLEFLTK